MKHKRKTRQQVQKLEETYALDRNPWGLSKRVKLSKSLGLTDLQVRQWFYQRRLRDDKKKKIAKAKLESSSSSEPDSVFTEKSKLVKVESWSSSSSEESDSSHSKEPLEAANSLGKIDSQQPLPQTKSRNEKEVKTRVEIKTRVEKEVKTRVASQVDSLRVEMDEKGQDMKVNLKKDRFESSRQKLMNVDSGVGDGISVGGGDSCGGGGDMKSKMISMLTERNKRDKAKYASLLNEIACLGKTIEATNKLIDDIKEVC